MNFEIFLKKKDYSAKEIEEIFYFFRQKNQPLPVKLAAEYLLLEDRPKKHSRRSARMMKAQEMFRDIERKCPKMKRAEKVKIIASKMNVKNDCIYVYLREMNL